MGVFKSLKEKYQGRDEKQHGQNEDDSSLRYQQHDQSPEISYDGNTTKSEMRRMFGGSSQRKHGDGDESHSSSAQGQYDDKQDYAPPPGPPPSSSLRSSQFPKSETDDHHSNSDEYKDIGSSGGGGTGDDDDFSNPPPYHSWLSVPDASLLPPPPSLTHEFSPSNNASFDSAAKGHQWCDLNPVYQATIPNQGVLQQRLNLSMEAPPAGVYKGKFARVNTSERGENRWLIKSIAKQDDATFMSTLPLYFAAVENPLLPLLSNLAVNPHVDASQLHAVTISYSVRIKVLPRSNAGIALGFASKPYPPFRLPGWHRASVAVHSDDGRRFTNDPCGGIDFVDPFRVGDEIRLSMIIMPQTSNYTPTSTLGGRRMGRTGGMSSRELPLCRTKISFERNGRLEGEWMVDEERDAQGYEGIDGLLGERDLYVAVGVFGGVEVELLL